MAVRRRKSEPVIERPYPYEVDSTLSGVKVRIKGEQGIYTIISHEFNPRNGKHWFWMFGGRKGYECHRAKHPMDVTPVKRGTRIV